MCKEENSLLTEYERDGRVRGVVPVLNGRYCYWFIERCRNLQYHHIFVDNLRLLVSAHYCILSVLLIISSHDGLLYSDYLERPQHVRRLHETIEKKEKGEQEGGDHTTSHSRARMRAREWGDWGELNLQNLLKLCRNWLIIDFNWNSNLEQGFRK